MPALDRDLAALIGLGLPEAEGFRPPGQRLRDLDCRVCGRRGTTLHHVIPNWICRATGAKETLESLCPDCHAAAERVGWREADRALRGADLLARAARRRPSLRAAVSAWTAWTRWQRRLENIERAGRAKTPEGERAAAELPAARRRLAPLREKLRAALREEAARVCLEGVDYLAMRDRWRSAGRVC